MKMSTKLRISRPGLDLIKGFEGFREHAARLPDGRWIVGYGHVKSAREGLSITEQDAEELLKADLRPVEEAIQSVVFAPLRQNQFDALASLVFNISPGQFKESEVLRALNAGDEIGAANGFDAWRRARLNGRLIVVDALVRRRAAEKALFLEHPGGRPVAPSQVLPPEPDPAYSLAARESAAQLAAQDAPRLSSGVQPGGGDVRTAVEGLARGGAPEPSAVVSAAAAPRSAAVAAESASIVIRPFANKGAATQAASAADPALVKERLARILEKGEREQRARPANPTAPIPEYDPTQAVGGRASRKLIDDTEIIHPGKDPESLFKEGLQSQRSLRGRNGGLVLNGGIWRVAPWIGFLAMSIIGLAVTLSIALQDRSSESPAAAPLAGTAVFAMLAILSIYFIATRGPDRRT